MHDERQKSGRRNHRLTIDIPVKIRYNGITVPGQSANLSCGGIYIRTPVTLPEEGRFELELPLPDGHEPLEIPSEKVWTKPSEDEIAEPEPKQMLKGKPDMHEADDTMDGEVTDLDPSEDPENSGSGFKFKSLNPEEKERIEQFIRRLMRQDTH